MEALISLWVPKTAALIRGNTVSVLPNRKGNLGYRDYSKYLAYSIESQLVGFGIQGSVVESFFR